MAHFSFCFFVVMCAGYKKFLFSVKNMTFVIFLFLFFGCVLLYLEFSAMI